MMENLEKSSLEKNNKQDQPINPSRRDAIKKIVATTAAMALMPDIVFGKDKKYEDWTLEEVYQDDIEYLKHYYDPQRLAYNVEKFKVERELKELYKEYEGDSSLEGKTPLEMVLFMHDEYLDMVQKSKRPAFAPLKIKKRALRNFTFRLIAIIDPSKA